MALVEENIILRFQTEATDALADTNKLNDNIASLNTTAAKTEKILAKGFPTGDITKLAQKIAESTNEAGKFTKIIEKLSNTDIDLKDLEKIEKEFTDIIAKVNLTESEMKVLEANIMEVALAMSEIDSKTLSEVAKQGNVLTKQFKSAKLELRGLIDAINSGDLAGNDLEIARKRAAALEDQIGDNREQIARLASDTRGLDTLVEGTRAVAAGFQIAEGAAAIFGDENEDVQKALLKVNAAMAISNGLQEAHALLLQNSNIAMKIASARQLVYTTVVGGSTGALKLFRIALALTGVGLLVIALGALIANFDKVKSAIGTVIPSFERIGSVIEGVKQGIISFFTNVGNLFTGGFGNILQNSKKLGGDVAKAFNDGYKANELDKINSSIADSLDVVVASQKRQLAQLEAGGRDSSKLQQTILENEKSILELRNKNKEDILDKQNELDILSIKRQKDINDRAKAQRERKTQLDKEAEDKRIKERQDRLQKELDLIEKNATDLEIIAQKEIKDAEVLADTLNRIELEKQLALNKTKLKFADSGTADASKLNLEILKIEQQIQEIFKTREPIAIQAIPSLGAPTSLKSGIAAFQEEINKLKISLLANPNNEDIQKQIDFYINAIERALDGKELGAELDLKNSILSALKSGDTELADKLITDGDVTALKEKISRLNLELNTGNLTGNEELAKKIEIANIEIELQEKINESKDEAAQKDKDRLALQRQYIDDIKNASLELTDTILDDAIRRKDGEIQIQQERVSDLLEIIDQGNTEQVQLEEQRLKKLNEEKQRYLNIQKRLAAIEIGINNAIAASASITAIANAFKEGNVLKGIATTIGLAASIASTIITVRNAFSDTPAFFEGTENTSKRNRGNVDGRGGFNAILHPNERVVAAQENNQLLKMNVRNKDLPKYVKMGMDYEKMKYSKVQDINIVNEYKELVKEYKKTNEEIRTLQSIILNSGTRFDITDENISVLVGSAAKRKSREQSFRK